MLLCMQAHVADVTSLGVNVKVAEPWSSWETARVCPPDRQPQRPSRPSRPRLQLPQLPPPREVLGAALGPPRQVAHFVMAMPLHLLAIALAAAQQAADSATAGAGRVLGPPIDALRRGRQRRRQVPRLQHRQVGN